MRPWTNSLALAALFLSLDAGGQVPSVLGYQGRLLKTDGTPEAGVVQVRFALFDIASGGTALWSEDQVVALSDGFYSVLLGSVTAVPATAFDAPSRWLAVSVAGTELAPRQRVGSVPFSLKTGPHAHGDADLTGTISVSKLPVGSAAGTVAAGDHTHRSARYEAFGTAACATGFTALYVGNLTAFSNPADTQRPLANPVCLDGTVNVDANTGATMTGVQGHFEEDDNVGRTSCAVCDRGPSGCYVHWGLATCATGYVAALSGWITHYANAADGTRPGTAPICMVNRITTEFRAGLGSAANQGRFNEDATANANQGWPCAICCAP